MSNEVKFQVTAETRQAVANLSAFLGGLRQLLGPVAALGSAAGFAALARGALNAADTLGKASQAAGVAVQEFAGMAYAAERADVGLDSFKTGLRTFSQELVRTGQGQRNLKEALLEQSRIFAAMPDGAAKATRAVQIFGRAGTQMIPLLNEGPEALERLFAQGERLSGVNEELSRTAEEFNDRLADLQLAARSLAGALALSLLPRVIAVINAATNGIVTFRDWTRESVAFEIAVKSVGLALAGLAAYKLGGLAVGGLAAFIGVGTVTSLKDFIALLQLMPLAASGAALALGKFALAIGAVTAAVTLAKGWWDYWESQVAKSEADLSLTKSTEVLTAALYRKIAADKEAGKISEEEYLALQKRIIAANLLADQAETASALSDIKEGLNVSVPGAGESRQPLTKEIYEQKRATLELNDASERLIKAQLNLTVTRETWRDVLLESNRILQEQLKLRTDLNVQAKDDGVITQQEFDEAQLEDKKVLIQLLQEEFDIKQQIIDSDFTLTEAEKFQRRKEAGIPQDGADPNSFGQNVSANLASLQNQFGTFSQASAALVTSGIGSAIQGISDGIMGLIDGTRTWAETWGSVLKSMAAQGIQFMVQQTAQFVLNNAKRLAAHIATESGMTAASLAQGALRIAGGLKEAVVWIIKAAAKAASSVADIPYVGWALALAALGGVIAAGKNAIDGAREAGGPVEGGKRYLVGERGPEFFVAPEDGYVLNNRDTMQVMRGGASAKGSSDGRSNPINLKTVIVANIQQAMEEVMSSPAGTNIIVQTVDGRRLDLGFNT